MLLAAESRLSPIAALDLRFTCVVTSGILWLNWEGDNKQLSSRLASAIARLLKATASNFWMTAHADSEKASCIALRFCGKITFDLLEAHSQLGA